MRDKGQHFVRQSKKRKLVSVDYESIPVGCRCEKNIFQNFIVNSALKGSAIQNEVREKENCNVPWAILLDPTSACNLHCTGCWAAEYGHKLNLSLETIDDIVTQGKN